MQTLYDQTGEKLEVDEIPGRIVSLVPSITELLAYLKLDERVAGITRFCVEPPDWYRTKTRLGGTKTPHLEKIVALRPDLIIANKEENVKEHVVYLRQIAPVYVSDVHHLESALHMIRDVSWLTGKEQEGRFLIQAINQEAALAELRCRQLKPRTAAYLIWNKPVMVAGGGTFIDHMLYRAGLVNVFSGKERYPEVSINEIIALSPEVVMLSSEPFPFKRSHVEEWKALLPGSNIVKVDGTVFSWYGSRILSAFKYIEKFQNVLK